MNSSDKFHLPIHEQPINGGAILQISGFINEDVHNLDVLPELLLDILTFESAERTGKILTLPNGRQGIVVSTERRLAPLNHPPEIN